MDCGLLAPDILGGVYEPLPVTVGQTRDGLICWQRLLLHMGQRRISSQVDHLLFPLHFSQVSGVRPFQNEALELEAENLHSGLLRRLPAALSCEGDTKGDRLTLGEVVVNDREMRPEIDFRFDNPVELRLIGVN